MNFGLYCKVFLKMNEYVLYRFYANKGQLIIRDALTIHICIRPNNFEIPVFVFLTNLNSKISDTHNTYFLGSWQKK